MSGRPGCHNDSELLDSLHNFGFPKVIATIIGRYSGPININGSTQWHMVSHSTNVPAVSILGVAIGDDIMYLLERCYNSLGSHAILRYDINNKTFLESFPIALVARDNVDMFEFATHYVSNHNQLLIYHHGLRQEARQYLKEAYIWDIGGTTTRRIDLSLNHGEWTDNIRRDKSLVELTNSTLAVSCDGSTIYSVSGATTFGQQKKFAVIVRHISSQTGAATGARALMVPHLINAGTRLKLIEADEMLWLFVDQMLFRFDALSLNSEPLQSFDLQICPRNATIRSGKIFIPGDELVVYDMYEPASDGGRVGRTEFKTVVTKYLTFYSGNLCVWSRGLCAVEYNGGWRVAVIT